MENQGPPRVIRPEDIADAVSVIYLKDGSPPLLNYPDGDLPKTLEMLATGLAIVAGLMKAQEEAQEGAQEGGNGKETKPPPGRGGRIVAPNLGQVVDINKKRH